MTPILDHRFPGMTFADIRTELLRFEAATDISAAVAKGAITPVQATDRAQMLKALIDDVCRFQAAFALLSAGKTAGHLPPAAHNVSWRARRGFLIDELGRRQRTYPTAIAKGRMTATIAGRQFDRLASLLHQFEDGYDFDQPRDEYTAIFYEMLDEERAGIRRDYRVHLDTVPLPGSSISSAPASGRPMVDKGPHHDRSRYPTQKLL